MNEENMFAVLRAATVGAGIAGTLLALWMGAVGVSMLFFLCEDGVCVKDAAVCVLCLIVLAGISGCCCAALAAFYRLCGRLAGGSAFTEENANAMARIARILYGCAGMLLAAVLGLVIVLLEGEFVLPLIFLLLFLCAFFGAGLLAQALSLLVHRAAALQQESDLTI